MKHLGIPSALFIIYRGLVKWYDRSLQNFWWEFDSLIPCRGSQAAPLFYPKAARAGKAYVRAGDKTLFYAGQAVMQRERFRYSDDIVCDLLDMSGAIA